MFYFFSATIASLLVTSFILRWRPGFGASLLDHDLSGPQKVHRQPVPRIGGVGVLVGLFVGVLSIWLVDSANGVIAFILLVCGLPAFGVGLLEDVTKRVSPRMRLAATAVAAIAAAAVLDLSIPRADIPGLDFLLAFTLGSVLLTILAVAGIANSINIIDGLNGLASMSVIIMLTAFAFVAHLAGDALVLQLSVIGGAAVLGFFVWNFPRGAIFLGDGGAYFLGFYIAELGILLLVRNEEISPLAPLLVCAYPIVETLFSIYRRRWVRSASVSSADGIHLHSLVYRRIVRRERIDADSSGDARNNSKAATFMWTLTVMSAVPAVALWNNTMMLGAALCVFVFVYVWLYRRIVRFRVPSWLLAIGRNTSSLSRA